MATKVDVSKIKLPPLKSKATKKPGAVALPPAKSVKVNPAKVKY